MLTKPKQKHPYSLWNKLLFAHHFELVVDMPLEECRERIVGLWLPTTGLLNPFGRTVWTQKTDEDVYEFEVHQTRGGRGQMGFTTAKITGNLFRDHGLEKTVVEGEVSVGVIFFMLFIILALAFFVSLSHFIFGWLAFVIAIEAVYGLEIRSDYLKLRTLIEEIFHKS